MQDITTLHSVPVTTETGPDLSNYIAFGKTKTILGEGQLSEYTCELYVKASTWGGHLYMTTYFQVKKGDGTIPMYNVKLLGFGDTTGPTWTVANSYEKRLQAANDSLAQAEIELQKFIDLNSAGSVSTVTSEQTSIATMRKHEVKTSTSTPNWKARIDAGEYINSPYQRSQSTSTLLAPEVANDIVVDLPPSAPLAPSNDPNTQYNIITHRAIINIGYTIQRDNVSSMDVEDALVLVAPDCLGDLPKADETHAVQDVYRKSTEGKYSFGASLGEGRQTVKHLMYSLERLATIVKSIKSGRIAKIAPRTHARIKAEQRKRKLQNKKLPRRLHKKTNFSFLYSVMDLVSDAWMEARFAIRPLLIDIEQVKEVIEKGLPQNRHTFRSGRLSSAEDNDSFYAVIKGTEYWVERSTLQQTKTSVGIIAELGKRPAAYELGFTSIASLAWELTMFSWVADYVVNMGGLLYHLNPGNGLKHKAAWLTTTVTRKTRAKMYLLNDDGTPTARSWEFSHEASLKDRSTKIGIPALISFENNLDIPKILDLTALLHGLLRGMSLKHTKNFNRRN
jgi:hypothetical protein